MRALLFLGLVLAPLACSSPEPAPPTYSGTPGQPTAATLTENVFVIPITIDGQGGPALIVDTGSPVVAVNPASAAGAAIPTGIGNVGAFGVGGLSFANAAVIGADIIHAPPDTATLISGVLGCTILCGLPVAFNYRDSQVTFGAGPVPDAVEPPKGVDFRLEGGGLAQLAGVSGMVQLPSSRIIITVTIEGADHPFIVDTGASSVFVRNSVFAKAMADGRGKLTTQVDTVEGQAQTTLFRLRSVLFAGAEVKAAPASQSAAIDALLDGVQHEIGQPIDGLLGGTFLREFFVTIDYPARHISLHRYATRDHIVDEATRVGIELSKDGAVVVSRIFAGTDADKQGVKPGDRIATIDGQATDALPLSDLVKRISGPAGSKHEIKFGCPGCTGFAGTRTLLVEDLIPLP